MSNSVRPYTSVSDLQDELDLVATLATLWRGKWLVALCALIGAALGWYYANRVAVPLYQSTAEIVLTSQAPNILPTESLFFGQSTNLQDINTEVRVINSRLLIGKMVEQLGLIDDPEFRVEGPDGSPKFPQIVDRVKSAISVRNYEFSYVFGITATTMESEKSALLANTLANLYIQTQLDEKLAETETASKYLSDKAAELKAELEAAERKVKAFNDSTQLVSAESLAALSAQLKDLRARRDSLRADIDAQVARDANLASATEQSDAARVADLSGDALLASLARDGADLTSERFQNRLRVVKQRNAVELRRARQQFDSLGESTSNLRAQIETQSNDLVQLQQLQRESQATGLLYESFLSRLKESAVQKGLQRADSQILSLAVPRGAAYPRKNRILALAAFAGMLIGIALVFLNDLRKNTFVSTDELEKFTGKTVLGAVPKLQASGRKDVLNHVSENPTSIFAESVRNLRTSILMSDVDHPPQVIMSTSSVPGEGKTVQALTLAQNMAGLGKRVLVVEGDIRRRVFAEIFNQSERPSFLKVLAGKASLQEAISQPEGLNFQILMGEKSTVNAADVFSSDKFADMIRALREEFDFIIIDTPPVLVVPDARVIGQLVDAIIYTVLWNGTPKAQVKEGLSMLEAVGLQVSGLSLSQVDIKKMRSYGDGKSYNYTAYANYYDT